MQAHAGLTEDLLASSEANKEMNDKKRAMTSSANFARSRTVTDGSCKFPDNLLGCENAAEFGNVKFLSDDIKLECEGEDKTGTRRRSFRWKVFSSNAQVEYERVFLREDVECDDE